MAILNINTVDMPNPSELSVGYMDLSSSESGRTQAGQMIKDVVDRKRVLSLAWNTLNWSDTSKILTAVEQSVYFDVIYPDPKDGYYVTKTFYVGDRKAPAVLLADGKEYWDGVSFDFIEK